jgi:hypothetical protein
MSKTISNNGHIANNAIRSKHRLAEISHHFLSNENERLPAWENTRVIPVLLGSKTDDYVVYELNQAFNRQNSSSMVLNIENRLARNNQLSSLANTETLDEKEGGLPDYCLIPASSPSTTLALQSDRLIIAVHASLAGVRVAYDQLSFMASLETEFKVCVIMLGARNNAAAKRFFGFLYDNAQSLLSLELECGGYLLQNDGVSGDISETHSGKTEDAEIENENIATDLNGVAANLLRQLSPSIKDRLASTRLAAPAGPAALLS